MRRNSALLLTAAVVAIGCNSSIANPRQLTVISGAVLADSSGTGLSGVRVALLGSDISTTTQRDGRFLLRHTLSGQSAMVLSRSGFDSLQLPPLNLTSTDTIHFSGRMVAFEDVVPPIVFDTTLCKVVLCNPLRTQELTGPLLIVDGVIAVNDDPSLGTSETPVDRPITSIEVVTGTEAIRLYGNRARRGVINVTTRRGLANKVVVPAPAGIQCPRSTTLDSRVRGNDGLVCKATRR